MTGTASSQQSSDRTTRARLTAAANSNCLRAVCSAADALLHLASAAQLLCHRAQGHHRVVDGATRQGSEIPRSQVSMYCKLAHFDRALASGQVDLEPVKMQ